MTVLRFGTGISKPVGVFCLGPPDSGFFSSTERLARA